MLKLDFNILKLDMNSSMESQCDKFSSWINKISKKAVEEYAGTETLGLNFDKLMILGNELFKDDFEFSIDETDFGNYTDIIISSYIKTGDKNTLRKWGFYKIKLINKNTGENLANKIVNLAGSDVDSYLLCHKFFFMNGMFLKSLSLDKNHLHFASYRKLLKDTNKDFTEDNLKNGRICFHVLENLLNIFVRYKAVCSLLTQLGLNDLIFQYKKFIKIRVLECVTGANFSGIDKYKPQKTLYINNTEYQDFITKIIEGGFFYKENSNFIGNPKKKNTNGRKEYAKVYQQENLRGKDKTKEIIDNNVINGKGKIEESKLINIKDKEGVISGKDALTLFNKDEVKRFIQLFKGIEVDENTNVEQLNVFCFTFMHIISEMKSYTQGFGVDIYKDILPKVFFKIRKLGQYKANGIFFPSNNTLAVDINGWDSIIHELGHLIHFNLAEILGTNKFEFLDLLTSKSFLSYDMSLIKNEKKKELYTKLQQLMLTYKHGSKIFGRKKKSISNIYNDNAELCYFFDAIKIKYKKTSSSYGTILEVTRPDTGEIDEKQVYWNSFLIAAKEKYNIAKDKSNYENYIISPKELFARFFDLTFQDGLSKKGITFNKKEGEILSFDDVVIKGIYGITKDISNEEKTKRVHNFKLGVYGLFLERFKILKNKK